MIYYMSESKKNNNKNNKNENLTQKKKQKEINKNPNFFFEKTKHTEKFQQSATNQKR